MTDPSGGRAFTLAERLGANQEARRLGHRLVGTEHVLMATLADPVVRWALNGVGCDLRAVQDRVTREGTARQDADRSVRLALTPRAAELVTRAAVDVPDGDLERRLDPRLNSRLLGTVVIALLRDDRGGAAVRILDELGVREHTPRLTAVIEQNAGPSVRPRPDRGAR